MFQTIAAMVSPLDFPMQVKEKSDQFDQLSTVFVPALKFQDPKKKWPVRVTISE